MGATTLLVENTLYAIINVTCICTLLVLLIMGWQSVGKGNRFYMTRLLVCEMLFCAVDFLWVFVEGNVDTPREVNVLLNALYFTLSGLTSYEWWLYVEMMMETKYEKYHKKQKYLLSIPMIILALMSFSAFFGDFGIFYISADNVYHRGPCYFVQPLVAFSYLIYASIITGRRALREKVEARRKMYGAMSLFVFAPIVCFIIQFFMPGTPMICVGCTVGIVFVFSALTIQIKDNQASVIFTLTDDYEAIMLVDLSTERIIDYRNGFLTHEIEDMYGSVTYNFTERIMRYVENFVFEEDRSKIYRDFSVHHLIRELERKKEVTVDIRLITENGLEYFRMKAVADKDFEISRLCVIGCKNVDDLTRREIRHNLLLEEARAQADSANKAKSTFLFNMSHDIRTPLNAILGFTNLAEKKIETDPELVKDYLKKIDVSGQHLLRLINDILDMARLEAGKITIEEQPSTVHGCGQAIDAMVSPMAADRNIALTVDYKNIKHEYLYADRLHLEQIMLNVVGNAVKYTRPGGKVDVVVKETECKIPGFGNYVVTVEDTGIGMNPEFLKHIFNSFERERSATISGVEGAGLGMSITKRLVDMMGGSIDIESELGVGTKVTMRFKIKLRDEDSVKAETAEKVVDFSKPVFDLRDKRILLVEDNELNREIAKELLLEEGIIVDCAEDGLEAVDKIKLSDPGDYDLILMDIQMPRLDGYEATNVIRGLQHPQLSKIPIVAMTANAFEEDRKKAYEVGMDGFISKPIDPKLLVATITDIIKK